jgi:hypothetical protein
MDFIFSNPPRAEMFFATSSSAVTAQAAPDRRPSNVTNSQEQIFKAVFASRELLNAGILRYVV